MFSSCRKCRKQLARRSEGRLPRYQWASLEAHLEQCASCRRIDAADRAMHLALARNYRTHVPMNMETAGAFNDRVMMRLLNEKQTWFERLLESVADGIDMLRNGVFSSVFNQLLGSALAAGTIAAMALTFAVNGNHVHTSQKSNPRAAGVFASNRASFLNGPPVPLQSLLDSSVPREARLWSSPPAKQRLSASNSQDHNNSNRRTAN